MLDALGENDLIKASNLAALFKKHGFDIKKFWIKDATGINTLLSEAQSLLMPACAKCKEDR